MPQAVATAEGRRPGSRRGNRDGDGDVGRAAAAAAAGGGGSNDGVGRRQRGRGRGLMEGEQQQQQQRERRLEREDIEEREAGRSENNGGEVEGTHNEQPQHINGARVLLGGWDGGEGWCEYMEEQGEIEAEDQRGVAQQQLYEYFDDLLHLDQLGDHQDSHVRACYRMFRGKQRLRNPFQLTAFLLLNGAQEEKILGWYELKNFTYSANDVSGICWKFREGRLSTWPSYDLKQCCRINLPGRQ